MQALGSTNDGNDPEPAAAGSDQQPSGPRNASDWTVAIYPVLAWAPIFGRASIFRMRRRHPAVGQRSAVPELLTPRLTVRRFAHHFGLTMGYGALHFQNSTTVVNRDYKTKQTLHGPIFGFGIYL